MDINEVWLKTTATEDVGASVVNHLKALDIKTLNALQQKKKLRSAMKRSGPKIGRENKRQTAIAL